MRIFKLPVSLLIILLTLSCKKENSQYWTEVHVKMMDYHTGDLIQFESCEVFYENIYVPEVKQIDYQNNISGEYEFGFKVKKDENYQYFVTFQPYDFYYAIIEGGYTQSVQRGEVNKFEIKLVHRESFQIGVTNVSCIDSNDEINVFLSNLDLPEFDYPNLTFPGCYDDVPIVGDFPIGKYALEWHVTKNNLTNIFNDTLILSLGTPIQYQIDY